MSKGKDYMSILKYFWITVKATLNSHCRVAWTFFK